MRKPRLIQECGPGLESEVWFKQDDQFNQPFVYAKVKICTNDLNFPRTVESQVFISLWQALLEEHNRETKAAAEVAGIAFGQTRNMEHLGFQLYCYNENYKTFFARVFENIRDFTPLPQFFEALRQRMVRVYSNHKLSEPCQIANNYFNEACFTDCSSIDSMLEAYENITYEKFLK